MGKYLEARSKGKTTDAIEKLMTLAPKKVIIESDGIEKQIPLEDLVVGDILIIKPGQTIGAVSYTHLDVYKRQVDCHCHIVYIFK